MTDKACPHCGQTLPALAPFGLYLTRGEQRIFERVARAGPGGVHIRTLIDHVWGDDPNGGPLYAQKSLHVRIWHLNKKLRSKGKEISCGNRHTNYVLRDAASQNVFLWVPRSDQSEALA